LKNHGFVSMMAGSSAVCRYCLASDKHCANGILYFTAVSETVRWCDHKQPCLRLILLK